MPNFLIAYHGGEKFENPEEGAAHMAKFRTWVASLGDAAGVAAQPLSNSKTVSAEGVSDSGPKRLTGFTIVKADTMDAALNIAKACPHLDIGSVEVAELMAIGK